MYEAKIQRLETQLATGPSRFDSARESAASFARASAALSIADKIATGFPLVVKDGPLDEIQDLKAAAAHTYSTRDSPVLKVEDPASAVTTPPSKHNAADIDDTYGKIDSWISRQISAGKDYAAHLRGERDQAIEAARSAQTLADKNAKRNLDLEKENKMLQSVIDVTRKTSQERMQADASSVHKLHAKIRSLLDDKDNLQKLFDSQSAESKARHEKDRNLVEALAQRRDEAAKELESSREKASAFIFKIQREQERLRAYARDLEVQLSESRSMHKIAAEKNHALLRELEHTKFETTMVQKQLINASQKTNSLQQAVEALQQDNERLSLAAKSADNTARSRSQEISRLRMEQQRAFAALNRRLARPGTQKASLSQRVSILLEELQEAEEEAQSSRRTRGVDTETQTTTADIKHPTTGARVCEDDEDNQSLDDFSIINSLRDIFARARTKPPMSAD